MHLYLLVACALNFHDDYLPASLLDFDSLRNRKRAEYRAICPTWPTCIRNACKVEVITCRFSKGRSREALKRKDLQDASLRKWRVMYTFLGSAGNMR